MREIFNERSFPRMSAQACRGPVAGAAPRHRRQRGGKRRRRRCTRAPQPSGAVRRLPNSADGEARLHVAHHSRCALACEAARKNCVARPDSVRSHRDHQVCRAEDVAEAVFFQRQVGEQMVIDDNDVGLHRRPARNGHVAAGLNATTTRDSYRAFQRLEQIVCIGEEAGISAIATGGHAQRGYAPVELGEFRIPETLEDRILRMPAFTIVGRKVRNSTVVFQS